MGTSFSKCEWDRAIPSLESGSPGAKGSRWSPCALQEGPFKRSVLPREGTSWCQKEPTHIATQSGGNRKEAHTSREIPRRGAGP